MHAGQERDPLNHDLTLIPPPSLVHLTRSLPGLASASLQHCCRRAESEKLLGVLKMKTYDSIYRTSKDRDKI